MSFENQSKMIIACLLLFGFGVASFKIVHERKLADLPSAAMSTIAVTSDNIADGLTPAQITLSIRTRSGRPVSGMAMKLWVSGSHNVIMPCGITDRHGFAQCRFFSTKAEQKTVVATGSFGLSAQTTFVASQMEK